MYGPGLAPTCNSVVDQCVPIAGRHQAPIRVIDIPIPPDTDSPAGHLIVRTEPRGFNFVYDNKGSFVGIIPVLYFTLG